MKLLDSITDSMDMNLGKLWETVKERKAWCAAVQGWQKVIYDLATEQQSSLVFSVLNSMAQRPCFQVFFKQLVKYFMFTKKCSFFIIKEPFKSFFLYTTNKNVENTPVLKSYNPVCLWMGSFS